MPETSPADEKLAPSAVMPAIPQTDIERRERSYPSPSTVHTGRPAPTTGSVQLVFRMQLTPELDRLLSGMAETAGGYSEMMREALGLLRISQEARLQNKRLVVVDDQENSEQEITP